MATMNIAREAVAAQVRAEAAAARMSWRTLATASDINYRTLCRKLNAQRDFTLQEIVQVASALNLAPSDLLSRRSAEVVA